MGLIGADRGRASFIADWAPATARRTVYFKLGQDLKSIPWGTNGMDILTSHPSFRFNKSQYIVTTSNPYLVTFGMSV